jgi:peptidoglycan/LPS O-acetylase OafA/YrhL
MKTAGLRFHEIDFLRGFACLNVLAFHFLSRGPATGTMPGAEFPLLASAARYGYLGVHLFFVISGFVILLSAQGASPRGFVASRASRLYPALWIGATLTAGTAWLLGDARFAVSASTYLVNVTMLPQWFGVAYVDGAYWSLAYELHFYIMVWLAIRLGLMERLEWLLAGWLLISAADAFRPMWPAEFWLNAKWAPFFTAGGVFYLVRTRGITPARLGLLAVSFVLAQLHALQQAPLASPGEPVFVPTAVVASVVTAVFALFWLIATGRLRMNPSPFIFYAGALTYPMYVIHQNLGFMIYGQLHKASGQVSGSIALMLVVLLAASWCIHRFIERPLSRVLRRWFGDAPPGHSMAAIPGGAQPGP